MAKPSVHSEAVPIEVTSKGLRTAGFKGFHHLYERREERFAQVPDAPGVYVVLRESNQPVKFLETDRSIPAGDLIRRWVPDAEVVYIGKADSLRQRLSGLALKGAGRAVSGWGGRLIWQIEDTDNLTVAWVATATAAESSKLRGRLLDGFLTQHAGRPPFGNQKIPR